MPNVFRLLRRVQLPTLNSRSRIFITGIQGLVGFNLYEYFRNRYRTIGFIRSGRSQDIKGEWYEGLLEDYSQIEKILTDFRPDFIFHAQAMCNTDLCEIKPDKTRLVNVKTTEQLIRASSAVSAKFIYFSSEHVFSGSKGGYTEDDPVDPVSVYGKTRVEAENLIRSEIPSALIIRPGLVVGPSAQGRVGPRDFMLSRLKKELPVSYFTDEIRTPILAEEFCAGIEFLLEQDLNGVLHVAGKARLSRYELACAIAEANGYHPEAVTPKSIKDDKEVPRIADCTLNSDKAVLNGWKQPSKLNI